MILIVLFSLDVLLLIITYYIFCVCFSLLPHNEMARINLFRIILIINLYNKMD